MLLPKPSSHFPPFGALLAEGVHLGLSTAPLPTPSMKTLNKQWLEVLSISQYVLCFVFLHKGSRGPLGKVGKGKVG